MEERMKQQAVALVRAILDAIHRGDDDRLPQCADEMEWDDPSAIRDYVQTILRENGCQTIDPYDPESLTNQTPPILIFYGKQGDVLRADYQMTADGGRESGLVLQIRVERAKGGFKRVFEAIDAM